MDQDINSEPDESAAQKEENVFHPTSNQEVGKVDLASMSHFFHLTH